MHFYVSQLIFPTTLVHGYHLPTYFYEQVASTKVIRRLSSKLSQRHKI